MQIPTMQEMLKAGAHFGHSVSKRHPKMEPYIFGSRNGVNIIDLEKTSEKLQQALEFVKETAAKGSTIIFVGTKRQAQELTEKYAKECQMPYVKNRWIGGTITNFGEISRLINSYKELKAKKESGELAKYSKKEQAKFGRELERMEKMVGGLVSMTKIPDAVYLIDLKIEETAAREAIRKNIPVVAICDTNVDPTDIAYPIPANDDATKAIDMITGLVSQAVKEGSELRKTAQLTETKTAEKKAAAKEAKQVEVTA